MADPTNPQNNTTQQNIDSMNQNTQSQASNLQNNANNQAGINPSAGTTTSQANTAGTSGTSSTPGTQTNRQQQGTGFTNIQNILNANQGAGQKLGNAIGGGLNNQASAIKSGIQAGQAAFQTGEQNSVNQANTNIGYGTALVQQPGESNDAYAARVAGDQDNLAQQGQALQNTSYTGPSGIANGDQLQSQAATVSALGQLAGSTSGQQELLRNFAAAKGNYSSGESALDQLLLGQGGQQAVQQGANSVYGVNGQAQNAVTAAQQQANSASNNINTQRANAIQAVQDAVTGSNGLMTQATNQANTFNSNASQLQALLQGVAGGTTTSLSPTQQALIQNMQQYGIDPTSSLYLGNQQSQDVANTPGYINSGIADIANGLQTNLGTQYYQGNQQAAGTNLAKFLGDQSLQSQIANNNFNTNVFTTDPTQAFANDTAEKNTDIGTQQTLQNLASQSQNLQNQVTQYGNLQNQIKNLGYSTVNDDGVTPLAGAGNNLASLSPQVQAQIAALQAQEKGLNTSTNYSTDSVVGGGQGLAQQIGNQNSTNGFLAFGDQGNNALSQQFQGLGLTAATNAYGGPGAQSGDIRSSQQFTNAANNALGNSQDLRSYILQQLGATGGYDPSAPTIANTNGTVASGKVV